MTHNQRKKNSRQRGSWTHGWGAKKKHRGAGHRGGRGNAGSGKRGDAKKPRYWKDTKYFGKDGFSPINKHKTNTIGISHLDSIIEKLITNGKATQENNTITINLEELKYEKLLGTGNTNKKINITIKTATQKAIDKIQKQGGQVTITQK